MQVNIEPQNRPILGGLEARGVAVFQVLLHNLALTAMTCGVMHRKPRRQGV